MYTAGPSGVVTVPCLSNPAFHVASDRSQVARRRVRLDLGELGIIEQQLNQSSNQLGSQAFCQCDAFASDWSVPRTLDRFLLPTIRPRFKSNVRLGIPNRLSIQHCNVWSDGLTALKRLASTVPVRQQVSGVLLLRPTTRRYVDRFATHCQGIARSCSVMRRSVTESLLLVTMLYFVMPNFVWKC